jgi:hypothetical protein
MTTSLDWPSTLPLPAIARYQLKPQPNIDRTETDVGPARQRRRSSQTPTEIPVQFELTIWELGVFESWYRYRACEGAAWFNITLLGGIGLSTHEARFKSTETPVYTPHNGATWQVTALLEVRDRPMLSDSDLTLLIGEDGDLLLSTIDAIHRTVSSGLWTS